MFLFRCDFPLDHLVIWVTDLVEKVIIIFKLFSFFHFRGYEGDTYTYKYAHTLFLQICVIILYCFEKFWCLCANKSQYFRKKIYFYEKNTSCHATKYFNKIWVKLHGNHAIKKIYLFSQVTLLWQKDYLWLRKLLMQTVLSSLNVLY